MVLYLSRHNPLCLLLLVSIVGSFCTPARAQVASAAAVKATFLYRFATYVEWPADAVPAGPITIGVVEGDAVLDQLIRIVPAIQVNGRQVMARRLRPGDSLEGIQILFVGPSTSTHARLMREASRGKPILLVTESPRGLADGGVINFVSSGRTVKFEISLSSAARSGLQIDSQLLSVASHVEGRPQGFNHCKRLGALPQPPQTCRRDMQVVGLHFRQPARS